ncbi:MAG: glycosyl hydrolase family 95 catalytic domain-containing protein [Candidatus Zhuqueibacterota bacterium]
MTGIIHTENATLSYGDYGAYQSLGDLLVRVDHAGHPTNYRRELDLNRAVGSVRYTCGDIEYNRTYFASYPARALVFHFDSNDPGGTNYQIRFPTDHHIMEQSFSDNQLVILGEVTDNGMKFEARMRFEIGHGEIHFSENSIRILHADHVTIYFSAATDYLPIHPNYRGRNFSALNRDVITKISTQSFEQILEKHVADYQNLFHRLRLQLGKSTAGDKSTDQRLIDYNAGVLDPQLEALYFQFGRYLLISSSRPGTLPANLQGKWNHSNNPPWACDYHTDINVEMNYWPAEVTNLSECHLPLIDFVESLRVPGRLSAREHFNAKGWIACTMLNTFGFTAPGWDFPWGFFPVGAAWLCQHVWEHFAFTRDSVYLRETALPLMKEAAEFWLDNLIENEDGCLVSAPSYSMEQGGISAGASMDHQIVWDLFTNILEARTILNLQDPLTERIAAAREKIAPPKIGRWGQLQEWIEDRDDPENKHRHLSHLFALHPGRQITLQHTPELARAARTSLEARGDGGTGWSLAWKISFRARLHEGDRAHQMLHTLLRPTTSQEYDYLNAGGTFPNLFCAHPPFQIDGNFGGCAGIAEMLLQSHTGEIHLLPALPSAWPDGEVTGLCARGGFVIDMTWRAGRLSKVSLRSRIRGECKIRYRDTVADIKVEPGQTYALESHLILK